MVLLIPCRAFHAHQGLWLWLLLLSVSAPAVAQPVSFTQFPVPTAASGLSNITMGPDAAVWFTEHNANKIGSITSAGKLTEYSIPTPNAGATGITAGPDGAVWFIESGSNKIARITTSGSIAEYTVPTSAAGLARIVAGSDGALWFTENSANKIGRISTSGVFTEYPVPGAGPWGIAAGTDHALWFAAASSRAIGRITTFGTVTQYPVPAGGGNPVEITDGIDGAVWFASSPSGVGSITSSGVVTIHGDSYNDITAGSDGSMWYVAFTGAGGIIGQFTLSGPVNSYKLPVANSQSVQGFAITTGPDGAIWIADYANNLIWRAALNTSMSLAPSIDPGGVVPVDGASPIIQPGEWVSIYGANLAGSTATWNGNFPTSLAGTSVTIDGKAAYISFVSPGQINIQAPNDTATGIVSVVVTTANGKATSTVTLAPFAPAFLLLDGTHVAGIIYRTDGSGAYGGGADDIIGPTGNSLGYPTVAAKPGDIIALFGVGFGPTTQVAPAGQAFSGAAATTNPVNILLKDDYVSVTPAFAGLSSAGLYQINLVVPAGLGTGDFSLVATVGGVQTPAVLNLAAGC